MNRKVTNLTEKREENREKSGWTIDEIKKKAAQDLKKYQKISRENNEPEDFHSGDMNNFCTKETTMAKTVNQPLTEQDKQTKPMPGETSPKDAYINARKFAQQIKSKITLNKAAK